MVKCKIAGCVFSRLCIGFTLIHFTQYLSTAGELGKLEVVNEVILHKCIQQLLEKKKTLSLADQAEDLECLCQIMKTVGKRLDKPKAKVCVLAACMQCFYVSDN